uniref:Uncharacterized protein n=1 Tax=Phlebotomus papatasi TaxID=29031 RepID=A0A1B0DGB7_PHLPP
MSLRDLFQEIKTEQVQQVFLPKTNSIVVKNIPEGNLDLHGVFPNAVDFVMQAKAQGVTAVVTFKTPEEAAEASKNKVSICGKEMYPRLLVGSAPKPKKSQKPAKKGQKMPKKEPFVFEKIEAGEDFGKKIHLWKLSKNIKLQVRKNWEAVRQENEFEFNGKRKELLGGEINFLRALLRYIENHNQTDLQRNAKNYPMLSLVQKDELLWRLRTELINCVEEQEKIIKSAKMPEGATKSERKFIKELKFLEEFRRVLTSRIGRKGKKDKKKGKGQK